MACHIGCARWNASGFKDQLVPYCPIAEKGKFVCRDHTKKMPTNYYGEDDDSDRSYVAKEFDIDDEIEEDELESPKKLSDGLKQNRKPPNEHKQQSEAKDANKPINPQYKKWKVQQDENYKDLRKRLIDAIDSVNDLNGLKRKKRHIKNHFHSYRKERGLSEKKLEDLWSKCNCDVFEEEIEKFGEQ
jgi:hypothetical protein